jgi:ribosomal protein L37AE/L43A
MPTETETITIDKLYSRKINGLYKQEITKEEKYKSIIQSLETKLKNIDDENDPLIDTIKKKLKVYRQKLSKNSQKKDAFLLENYDDLMNYFVVKQGIDKNNNPKKMIYNFFNKKATNEMYHTGDYKNSIESYVRKNNYDIYDDQYMNVDQESAHICEMCKVGELICSNHDGIMICNKCSASFKYLIHNDKPSYKEPPKEISFYAYRRINHFKEILSQFQAKESTDIPHEIIENIKAQIKKERIKKENLTNKKTKEILKKLGYNKYYEHIPFIKDKLGIKPPVMSPHLEETLCNLFIDIQIPYAKFCPLDRVNFLNYYYTLYKLCELLGETSYLPHFPMLKEQKKIEQDEIWKQICKELDWDFIPTL